MERTPFYEQVRDRLIRYARVDTQSDRRSSETPTSKKQFDLAYMLRDELVRIGAADVWLDEAKCVVYGRLPATAPADKGMAFGLVTHMDTAPDAPGAGCKPWVLEDYDGGDILLNPEEGIIMSPRDFPNLLNYVGQDLILTDGTTLLGGDDKAAIAAVMTMAEHLLQHPELPHGEIALGFTPDEEVGGLARDLDLTRFGVKVAYTLDGDYLGYYEDETFNASHATVTFEGRSVHTGTAKGILINAAEMAAEFVSLLPPREKPQFTEGREGFFHLVSVQGNVEQARVDLIVRDHNAGLFARREQLLRDLAAQLAEKYGPERVSLTITPTYRNMKEVIDQYPFLVENLTKAIRLAGLDPQSIAFRGGTDGSALSHRGLPCPNLSAGYENAHGRFEYVPIRSMEKNVEILLHLARLFGETEA
jgi:tripeptide aminopeptidase